MKFCDRIGIKCCNANVIKKKCLKPCFGIYADVYSVHDEYQKSFESWDFVQQRYKAFKNLFENISFPKELDGKC